MNIKTFLFAALLSTSPALLFSQNVLGEQKNTVKNGEIIGAIDLIFVWKGDTCSTEKLAPYIVSLGAPPQYSEMYKEAILEVMWNQKSLDTAILEVIDELLIEIFGKGLGEYAIYFHI